MNSGPVRLLLFDLDDTLWPCKPVILAAEKALYEWLRDNVQAVTRRYTQDGLREHRIAFARREPGLAHDLSRVRIEAFRALANELGLGEDWIEPAFEVFLDARQRVTPYPDVIPTLDRLSGKYRMAAVTNGNADINRTSLAQWLSFSVTAADAGAQKPDPRMFEMALQKAGVSAEECLLVGDDEHRDIYGAARAGMRTAWINRDGREWQHPSCSADHHIRSLDELPGLLEQLEAQVGYNPSTEKARRV